VSGAPSQPEARTAARPLHIVQVSFDASLLDGGEASDSIARQKLYSRLLAERRPGSRMTIVVLNAPATAVACSWDNLHVVPISGRWASLRRLPAALRALDREAAIGVIAAQSPFEDAWAALMFARRRIPVVVQVHFDVLAAEALPRGSMIRRLAGKARQRLALRSLRRFASVRVVAAAMKRRLEAAGARDVRAIPVPVLDLETLVAVAEAPRHEPNILYVGRLAPEKRLDLWLEAARRIRDEVSAATFDIVGSGGERGTLERQAAELGLASAVTFHGHARREELPEHFARARVLMLSSDHEGFGRVLLEAMAAGVAVVSTATAGAREIIAEGSGAGALVPVGDAAALAAAASPLLTDDGHHCRMVDAARAHIRGRYDPMQLAVGWVEMLIDVAERGP